jgi:hypothetical protein
MSRQGWPEAARIDDRGKAGDHSLSPQPFYPRVTPGPGDMGSLGPCPRGQPAVLFELVQQPVIDLIERCHLSSGGRFYLIHGSHSSVILIKEL